MESNETLYRSFLAGDEHAFTLLMERIGDHLTLYIYGYTRDFGEAEDLMIEAFAYLIAKKPNIRENGLRAYLYKTARHMAIRSLQKKRRSFAINLEQVENLTEEKTLVDSIVNTNEKHQILHMCMEELSPDYREAIWLVYFEGMSHKEAALVMKKREKQVSDLIFRSRKSLKIKLEREGIHNA